MEIKKKNRSKKINKNLGILNMLEDEDISLNKNEIDISLIEFNEINFYSKHDNEDTIRDLAESIKEIGLLHNIVVVKLDNGKYKLISGEKRTKAYKMLWEEEKDNKWKTIPCKVIADIKNSDDEELALIRANRDVRERSDIIKAEEVKRLERIYEKKKAAGEKVGIIRKNIANDLGLSETQVQRLKKANDLIPEFKQMIENQEIALSVCEYFANLQKDVQMLIYNSIVKNGKKINRDEAKVIRDEMKEAIAKLDETEEGLENDEVNCITTENINSSKDTEEAVEAQARENKNNIMEEKVNKIVNRDNTADAEKKVGNKETEKISDVSREIKIDVEISKIIKKTLSNVNTLIEKIEELKDIEKSLNDESLDILNQIKDKIAQL